VLWSGRTFTWSLDREQLESYLQNDQRRYWTGLDPVSGNPVGHASLLVDDDAAMMRLGCILLDPAARGRGLGRDLISTAVRTGFGITELPAMKLGVYAHNVSARGVYEDLGFRETGRVRSTEVNGQPWHAVEMERPRLR
jgi:RimJ/RimL family protein N-acetyltransferase